MYRIHNPRNTYFDLSRKFYKSKYIDDDNKKVIKEMPASLTMFRKAKPIYKKFEGWNYSLAECENYESLPDKAREFLGFIESFVGVKISLISNGPNREDLIHR